MKVTPADHAVMMEAVVSLMREVSEARRRLDDVRTGLADVEAGHANAVARLDDPAFAAHADTYHRIIRSSSETARHYREDLIPRAEEDLGKCRERLAAIEDLRDRIADEAYRH